MLGNRALMELDAYLKNEYPDSVQECTVCNDLVTRVSVFSSSPLL
jgi:hypothetical protein